MLTMVAHWRDDPHAIRLDMPSIKTGESNQKMSVETAHEALNQRINSLHEWAHSEHDAMEKLFDQRMASVEKAVEVAHDDLVRVPTDVDKAVKSLRELIEARMLILEERFKTVDEKFNGIAGSFKERDTRSEQSGKDNKVAVDAAFAASKEAVAEQNKSSAVAIAKSEAATMKSIDQQAVIIATATGGLNDKIEDLKERLGRVESIAQGRADQKTTQRDDNKLLIAVASLLAAIVGIAIGYFAKR